MKTRLFTIFAIAVAVIAASAAPITRSQALQRAQQSLTRQGITFNAGTASMAAKAPARGGNTETAAYYIFNSSNSFVIASGDDRMTEVLGYSEGSTFDANDIPDGLKNKSSYPDADVNGDGKVDVADMNAIINMILGL